MPELSGQVSALSPQDGAIDGSARPKPSTIRPRNRRAAARERDEEVIGGWGCPRCGQRIDPSNTGRHAAAEMKAMEKEVDQLTQKLATIGPEGVRWDFDELGHVLWFPPDDELRPAVYLTFEELLVDPSVQRDMVKGHKLLRRDAKLDPNLTEALDVVPVYGPGEEDGEGGTTYPLLGYRVVEGQHRAILGQKDVPHLNQLCKILPLETQVEESATALTMATTRSAFRWIETWHALVRSGNPNVVTADALLRKKGLHIGSTAGTGAIAAAKVLLTIIGIPTLTRAEHPAKDPQEGARDLENVLNVAAAFRPTPGSDDLGRYSNRILKGIADIYGQNEDLPMDPARFALNVASKTVEDWVIYADPGRNGSAEFLRLQLVKAYNKGIKSESKRARWS
jgi:hypothetical protein